MWIKCSINAGFVVDFLLDISFTITLDFANCQTYIFSCNFMYLIFCIIIIILASIPAGR